MGNRTRVARGNTSVVVMGQGGRGGLLAERGRVVRCNGTKQDGIRAITERWASTGSRGAIEHKRREGKAGKRTGGEGRGGQVN